MPLNKESREKTEGEDEEEETPLDNTLIHSKANGTIPTIETTIVMSADEDEEEEEICSNEQEEEEDNFYPIFLPIDKNFEAKYLFHYRSMKKRGRSIQERVYVFLEHPVGWGCFIYHMSV